MNKIKIKKKKLGKINTKGSMVKPRWKPEAKRVCFCSLDALKTYDYLWERENQVTLTQ
jgi:hypothetical protein